MPTEFKVLYSSDPTEQWKVHYDDQRVGYPARITPARRPQKRRRNRALSG